MTSYRNRKQFVYKFLYNVDGYSSLTKEELYALGYMNCFKFNLDLISGNYSRLKFYIDFNINTMQKVASMLDPYRYNKPSKDLHYSKALMSYNTLKVFKIRYPDYLYNNLKGNLSEYLNETYYPRGYARWENRINGQA